MEYKVQKQSFSKANSSKGEYAKEFGHLRDGANCVGFTFAGSISSEWTINSILGVYKNDCMHQGGVTVGIDPNIDGEYLRCSLKKLLAFFEDWHPSKVEALMKDEDACGLLITLEEDKKEIVCLVNDVQN